VGAMIPCQGISVQIWRSAMFEPSQLYVVLLHLVFLVFDHFQAKSIDCPNQSIGYRIFNKLLEKVYNQTRFELYPRLNPKRLYLKQKGVYRGVEKKED
jgi:hypothetical protein